MGKLKFLELFSGIGGYRLGLEEVGYECVGHVERSMATRKAYQAIHGQKGLWKVTDIRRANKMKLQELTARTTVDLVCGGLPSITVPVDRGGVELFDHVLRVSGEVQAKSLLFSTTVNIVNHDDGKTLAALVSSLSDAGYCVDYEVLNSRYFGVPQGRNRLYIVAVRNEFVESVEWLTYESNYVSRSKIAIGKNPNVNSFNFQWMETGNGEEKLVDVLEAVVNEKYYITDEHLRSISDQMTEYHGHIDEGCNPVLVIKEATNKGYTFAEEGDSINIQYPTSKTRRGRVGRGVANTVITTASQGIAVKKGGGQGYTIRKLTPKENWRLQGISDSVFERVRVGRSDSELYNYAGNTVTVGVISAIGEELSRLIKNKG